MASIGSIGYSASCYCPVSRIGTETPVFERFSDRARRVVVLAQQVIHLLPGHGGEAMAVATESPMGSDPRQILPEIAQRGARARDLAERLAEVLADPSISPDNVLFGLLLEDARLTVLEGYISD